MIVELCTKEEWICAVVFNLNVLSRILSLLNHCLNNIRIHASKVLVNLTQREDVRQQVMFERGVHSLLHAIQKSDDQMKKIIL